MKRALTACVWVAIAVGGALALGKIALYRGESISATWFVIAAVCSYLVAYRLYSAFISAKLLALDDTRATPAERLDDGRDFVPTNKWVLFGHHFAAIAGPGPLVGPTLAAQFGYLPGTLVADCGLGVRGMRAGFHYFVLLDPARRKNAGRNGARRSEPRGGFIAQIAVLAIMVILLGVVALVIVNALKSLAVGHVYAGDDDSDRAAAGRVLAIFAAGQSAGGFADRRGAGACLWWWRVSGWRIRRRGRRCLR